MFDTASMFARSLYVVDGVGGYLAHVTPVDEP
jgi:hypothetical protein